MSQSISTQGNRNEIRSAKSTLATLATMAVVQGVTTARATLSDSEVATLKETSATQLDRVVVEDKKTKAISSTKFTEPLRDTPQTIVVVPSEVFLQQGAASLSDVLRNTSGITFAAGEGGGASGTAGDAFYMRGFDTTNNIFVDGVRDIGAYSRDVYNLEQVEIAKGPAGSDIGRGGASGYVNVSTKTPRFENFVAGGVSYGFDENTSGSRRRSTLDINQTVSTSPVKGTAVRVNALWQDNDGVGRDFAESKSWAIAPSIAVGLQTPTRATLAYQHVEQNNLPDYGLPTAQLPGYLSPVPVPQVDRSTFYGFTTDSDKVTSDAVVGRIEHDFSTDLKFTSQLRYSANRREAVVTVPGQNGAAYVPATGLLTRSRQATKRDTEILSAQTNLFAHFATGALTHNFTGGFELARENAYSPAFTSVTLTAIPIQSPNPHATPNLTPFRSGVYTDVETETAALYAFDTVKFSERWQANASVRAERYQTHFLSVAANGAPTVIDAKHAIVSWKTGLVFKPAPAGSLYIAYANSLTPPGTDFTLSSAAGNQNNPDSDPQETSNIEVGMKWDFFRGRLSTNAAVFKTVNDKTVYTDAILGPIPAGKQTVQGAEVGLSRRFTDNWIVLGSISYLESEINAGTTAGGNLAGSALPLIPRWSGNLFTSYRFPSGIIIGGGGQYSDEVARRDNNTPAVPRTSPSYWLFNALVSYPVGKNFTVRLNVNNLFDEEFVQSLNNNGARFNPGAPRACLLSADFRF
ncbi:MAG TPA: TonB-dependent siderophore receptor [Opitutaceae bacterium]|nr:TonB-dependent siderophore receptor [Opitutaceae bacterium]